ncbi:sensory neuron membrane protein 1-like [Ischnura elegans]|uniref:sensory neuron membrane protein 1-like n=1 Tax=Ischnura elegans TaxID=197161 RepID=UPI001ED886D5|nr:sensory neuron membrane protein 1-like [Ischnura elegans]
MSCGTRRKVLVTAFVGGASLVIAGFLLGYVVFPTAVRLRIIQSVQLSRGSDALQRYIKTPMPVQIKVYVFNVTNPSEVQHGSAPPLLRQVGPYVYDLYKDKVEIEEDFDLDTLTYYMRNTYHFNRGRSIGEEDDRITVLNAPLLALIDRTASKSAPMLTFLNTVLAELFSTVAPRRSARNVRPSPSQLSPFMETTVGGIMFHGVPIKCSRSGIFRGFVKSLVCQAIGSESAPSIWRSDGGDGFEDGDFLFAFLKQRNNTRFGPISVRRGLKDIGAMGHVVSWQEQTVLKAWGPPYPEESPCNRVSGTDSSVIPPFLDEKSVITVFQPEMCRSLSAMFEQRLEFEGIPALRFVADPGLFDTPARKPSNWCYYPSGDSRARDEYWAGMDYGAQDISSCVGGPLVVSYPHFYSGSHKYLEYARGLNPRKERHETFIDLEAMTATPLRAAKRLQFNLRLKRNSRIIALKNVTEGLFPILWVEESMSLEPKFTNLINENLFDVIHLLSVIQWGTTALGVMVIVTALVVSRGRWNNTSANAEDKKMREANQLPTFELSPEDGSTDRYG